MGPRPSRTGPWPAAGCRKTVGRAEIAPRAAFQGRNDRGVRTMKHATGLRLGALAVMITAAGAMAWPAPASAQTDGMERRNEKRDAKQEGREETRDAAEECKDSGGNRIECQQDKREDRRENRQDARDEKYDGEG